ncbi:hypothetical protein ACSN7O_003467 [Enterobacter chuandaensis]
MKKNSKTRVILITAEQFSAIERLQQQERSPLRYGTNHSRYRPRIIRQSVIHHQPGENSMTTNSGELTANINTTEAGTTSSLSEIAPDQMELQRENFQHGCAALLNDINHAARADDLLHRTRRAEVELKMLSSYLEGQVSREPPAPVAGRIAITAGYGSPYGPLHRIFILAKLKKQTGLYERS